ncbi:MAG: hypothetical protein ACI9CD_000830 [Candidatus Deianiraeaceae bacterium]|jgi:hypothetical protein
MAEISQDIIQTLHYDSMYANQKDYTKYFVKSIVFQFIADKLIL